MCGLCALPDDIIFWLKLHCFDVLNKEIHDVGIASEDLNLVEGAHEHVLSNLVSQTWGEHLHENTQVFQ